MRSRLLTCAALGAALFVWSPRDSNAAARQLVRLGLINQDGVQVRSQPAWSARALTVLVQQSQVNVLGGQGAWWHVKFWASLTGWVPKADVVFRKPWPTTSTYQPPEIHNQVHARPPVPIRGTPTGVDRTLAPWLGASPPPRQGQH